MASDPGLLNRVPLRHGIMLDAGDMAFNVRYVESAENDERPSVKIVAIVGEGGDRYEFVRREGDSFEVAGQVWKVAEINRPDTKLWNVLLTRENPGD